MRTIRLILDKLILFFNWLFSPRSIRRDPALQTGIDEQTASLRLYQKEACPFWVKFRRAISRRILSRVWDDLNCTILPM